MITVHHTPVQFTTSGIITCTRISQEVGNTEVLTGGDKCKSCIHFFP